LHDTHPPATVPPIVATAPEQVEPVTSAQVYATRHWRNTIRPAILHRDAGLCRIQWDRGCTTLATCVDHIVELDAGGAPFDPHNLRAACAYCNGRKARAYVNRKAARTTRPPGWGVGVG
jgi:5-methylcytosine-specific restriction endonuclease McrA